MFKVIIAGGRDFNDYQKLRSFCNKVLINKKDIEIISGKARGADSLGEKFAKENNYQIVEFPADWNKFGKKAGYIRNEDMAEYADALIAFWNKRSAGTKNMIDIARNSGLPVRICYY